MHTDDESNEEPRPTATNIITINFGDGPPMEMDRRILALSSPVLRTQFSSAMAREQFVVNLMTISRDEFENTIYAWFFKDLHDHFEWHIVDVLEKMPLHVVSRLYTIVDQYDWKFKEYLMHFMNLKFQAAIVELNDISPYRSGLAEGDTVFTPECIYIIFPYIEFFIGQTDHDETERGFKYDKIVEWIQCLNVVALPKYKNYLNTMIDEATGSAVSLVDTAYSPTVDDITLFERDEKYDVVVENIGDVKKMLLDNLSRIFCGNIRREFVEEVIKMMANHSWLFDPWTTWEHCAFERGAEALGAEYPIYSECRAVFLGTLTIDNIFQNIKRFRIIGGANSPSTFSFYLKKYREGEFLVQPFTKLCEDYMYAYPDMAIEALTKHIGPLDYDITEYFGNLRLLQRARVARGYF